MAANPVVGVVYHWLGGLASGSFYVPYRGVRRWAWETYWLAGGFFSWIIAPWILAGLLTKDLLGFAAGACFSSVLGFLLRAVVGGRWSHLRLDYAVPGAVAGNGRRAGTVCSIRDARAADFSR